MRWLITDLDHTLCFPLRKKETKFKGENRVVFQRDSDPTRGLYTPESLRQFFMALAEKRVASTARGIEDINKLDFGFDWDYIIALHGAEIYQSGRLIKTLISSKEGQLISQIDNEAIELIKTKNMSDGIKSHKVIRTSSGVPCYIEIKLKNEEDAEELFADLGLCLDLQFGLNPSAEFQPRIHLSRRLITIKPSSLDKAFALSHLVSGYISQEDREPFFIGAGDSKSDLPFMRLCHVCIAPSDSQIMHDPSEQP